MGHKLENLFNKKIKQLAKTEKESLVEKNKVAVEKNKVAVEKNKASVEKNKVAVEKNKVPVEKNKVAVEKNKVAVEKNKVAVEKNTDKNIKIKHDQAKAKKKINSLEVFYLFYCIHFDILY